MMEQSKTAVREQKAVYSAAVKKQSHSLPVWSCSQARLASDFFLSRHAVGSGLRELASFDIVEIRPSSVPDGPNGRAYAERHPSTYLLKPLRSQGEIDEGWKQLKDKYGVSILKQARKLAGILDLERNQAAVRTLSEAILEYGYKAVRKVCRKVGRLRRDNPRRTVDYALGILVPMSLSPTKTPESERHSSFSRTASPDSFSPQMSRKRRLNQRY